MDKINSHIFFFLIKAESKSYSILFSAIIVSYTHQHQNREKVSALFMFLTGQLDGPSEAEVSFNLFSSALFYRLEL